LLDAFSLAMQSSLLRFFIGLIDSLRQDWPQRRAPPDPQRIDADSVVVEQDKVDF
jgi:hypothetical protein